MCIHPKFGPWIALRAVIIVQVDTSIPDTIYPSEFTSCFPNPYPQGDHLVELKSKQFTLEYTKLSQEVGHRQAYERTWKLLLDTRDAAGDFKSAKEHRYSNDQIIYHYLKNVDVLSNSK